MAFPIEPSDLAFAGAGMHRIVEPGAFDVWVGPDSTTRNGAVLVVA